MSTYTVAVNADDLKRVAKVYRIGGKLVDVAVARAVNRGGDSAGVAVRARLVQTTGISDKDTRRSKGITRVLATPARPSYRLKARSSYTPLSYYGPVQTSAGVRAAPWNRSQVFAGTFMLRMSTGYTGVFKRDMTAARQQITTRSGKVINARPIKELWGPSLAVEMMRGDVPEVFRAVASEKTMARLPHELQFALDKASGKKSR